MLGGLWLVCCHHLSAEWNYNEQYSYGWFVPFFALYLFWLRWEDRPQPEISITRSKRRTTNAERLTPNGEEAGQRGFGENSQPSTPTETGAVDRRALNPQLSVIAILIAITALLLLLPIRLIEIANPDWRPISWIHTIVAVTVTLLVIWRLGGKPWLRHFAFPVAFVLVAVPWISAIEMPIIQGLMPTLASIATEALSLFGIPAEVQGNLVRINGGVVGVNEACSGVRSLQTSIMIGLLFGELKRLSVVRRILLVAGAIAIAFVANCGRAFFLVWIAATHGIGEVEKWHDTAGYTIVGLVFAGSLGITAWLARGKLKAKTLKTEMERSEDTGQKSEENGGQREKLKPETLKAEIERTEDRLLTSHLSLLTFSLIAAFAWLVLVELAVEWWYRSHEKNLPRTAQWSVQWPKSAPNFRELPIDERTRGLLHFDKGQGAAWRESTDHRGDVAAALTSQPVSLLYFFRWEPGHNSALLANAHRPDVCLPATGWRQTDDLGVREYRVSSTLSVPFRHFIFVHNNAGRTQYAHAFYCVWEDRARPNDQANPKTGMAGEPSAWTRNERLEAVREGRRHLGQQVLEYLIVEPNKIEVAEAEETFAQQLPQLIQPASKSAAE
jgi:exosortase